MACFPAVAKSSPSGKGVDSQILWRRPGPSAYALGSSSLLDEHLASSLGVGIDYYRRPLGLRSQEQTSWVIERVSAVNFAWSVGLLDRFQLGAVVPVIVEQQGQGTRLLTDETDETFQSVKTSAVGDMRFHFKTLLWQSRETMRSHPRMALDVALSVPTGDEDSFAGGNGVVIAPQLIFDVLGPVVDGGIQLGIRLRSGTPAFLADATVGNQLTVGTAASVKLLEQYLMLGVDIRGLTEVDDPSRVGVEVSGALGTCPGRGAVTMWLTGGTGIAVTGTPLLGVPMVRFTLGVVYTPSRARETVSTHNELFEDMFGAD